MQTVTSSFMRNIEETAFAKGVHQEVLMDRAAQGVAANILRYYPSYKKVTAYVGKGHNGGIAIMAAHYLKQEGWDVRLRTHLLTRDFDIFTKKKLNIIGEDLIKNKLKPESGSILIDGLTDLDSNTSFMRPATEMNYYRNVHKCKIVAVDLPSGVDPDTGEIDEHAVMADLTVSLGYPKVGLSISTAVSHVGAISHVMLNKLSMLEMEEPMPMHLITSHSVRLKRRKFDTHKGQMGHVGIWAGSEGMLGAAALVATAAIKAGAGLVTLFITPDLYSTLSQMVPYEVMVKPVTDPSELLDSKFDALILGPGMGSPPSLLREKLFAIIESARVPVVLDADMLNLIAEEGRYDCLHEQCILTPHFAEMSRLFPDAAHVEREVTVFAFTDQYPGVLVYKGARSIVSSKGSPLFINTTGTPAMATAGQGDVLAGLIGGLCAQNYTHVDAAKIAIWLAGESSQLALASQCHTEETLTASATIDYLPRAFQELDRRL